MTWKAQVSRRVRRWRRHKAIKGSLLWAVAGLAAVLAWFGRRNA